MEKPKNKDIRSKSVNRVPSVVKSEVQNSAEEVIGKRDKANRPKVAVKDEGIKETVKIKVKNLKAAVKTEKVEEEE